MKQRWFHPPFVTAFTVLVVFLSFSPLETDAAELHVPKDYALIQTAIDAAAPGDSVVVDPGVYQESLTLKDNVEVRGRETARTFLSAGGGAGPIVSVSGDIGAAIRNFTFINTAVGIQVSNDPSAFDITNNVFEVGTSGAAIIEQNAPALTVVNNTFSGNGTAVSRDADITISNNIFTGSQVIAIAGASVGSANIKNNDFFDNVSIGPIGANVLSGDPLFVDPAQHDFHLQQNSPCIDAGDPSVGNDFIDDTTPDVGAYGGPFADAIPFPVSGLTIQSNTGTSIDLTWLPNNSYLVAGYALYYGYASGIYNGTDADSGTSPSPIDVGPDTTFTLADLSPSSAPTAPVLNALVPRDGGLVVTWSAAADATGYKVHFGAASPGENSVDAGNTTSYTITGLTNGQPYRVAVSSYSVPKYYIVVTAYDILNTVLESSPTGTDHESAPSNEVSVQIGPLAESGLSNMQIDYPDAVAPYPALPNSGGGCFVATAAYGSYSAPEVVVLRSFRDACLMTSAPGRLFVKWYYTYGPYAAALLNNHPAFKPAVRAALLPLVGAAFFLTQTSTAFKAGVLLFIGLATVYGFTRKKRSAPRGPC